MRLMKWRTQDGWHSQGKCAVLTLDDMPMSVRFYQP